MCRAMPPTITVPPAFLVSIPAWVVPQELVRTLAGLMLCVGVYSGARTREKGGWRRSAGRLRHHRRPRFIFMPMPICQCSRNGGPDGPQAFPALIGIGLLVSGLLLCGETWRRRRAAGRRGGASRPIERQSRRILAAMTAWTALYYFAFDARRLSGRDDHLHVRSSSPSSTAPAGGERSLRRRLHGRPPTWCSPRSCRSRCRAASCTSWISDGAAETWSKVARDRARARRCASCR